MASIPTGSAISLGVVMWDAREGAIHPQRLHIRHRICRAFHLYRAAVLRLELGWGCGQESHRGSAPESHSQGAILGTICARHLLITPRLSGRSRCSELLLFFRCIRRALSSTIRTSDTLCGSAKTYLVIGLSLIHISEPTRHLRISYAVFCL